MAGDLEKLAVDIERPVGCISRVVFWVLFVIFAAILGAIGWLLYTSLWAGSNHISLGSENNKDALIVVLSVVVLAMALAAIIRDNIRNRIYQRVLRKRNKS